MELSSEDQQRRALAIAGIAIALFVVGWMIGREGGSDVDAARLAGAKAGEAAGRKAGKKAGYDAGFKKGETTSYKAAYSKAYNAANPDGE